MLPTDETTEPADDETTEPADDATTEPADDYALVRSGTCEQAGRSVVLDGTCGTTCNEGVCHTQGMALGWDIGWTNQVYSLTSWSAWGSRPPGCHYMTGDGHQIFQSALDSTDVECSEAYVCLCGPVLPPR